MQHPLVSVALCTYNSGVYLEPLLESLLAQSYKNVEIICCDDNSSDGTQTILLSYQQKYPGLFKLYLNEKNIGYIKNFEQALSLCHGDFIAIADHDDIWKKEKIETLMTGIGDAMLVYGDSIYIDSEGKETGRRLTTKFNLTDKPDPRSFAFANSVWGHTVLLKKDLLKTALPIPEKIPYDIWLAYVAASISYVQYLPEPLTFWRQHEQSFSAIHYSRKKKKTETRFADWEKNLYWIKVMKDFPGSRHHSFLERLYFLYKRKGDGTFVWPLYFFLLKNRKVLFIVWKRSLTSSLNEFRKMARGVKQDETTVQR
ncbi:MAG: glycosyltransferase [Chitinophagaceae bacterium]